jgi:hypothetical protein
VTLANAGHVTTNWSPWARRSRSTSYRHCIGDTSCAANTLGAMANPAGTSTGILQLQGVGKIPLYARDAVPATAAQLHGSQSLLADRQTVSVAWAAVDDAVYQEPFMTGTAGRKPY